MIVYMQFVVILDCTWYTIILGLWIQNTLLKISRTKQMMEREVT